ncbi:MAG: hypothetical protein MI861_24680 [Pirellulales bacterium]|nr:hypothetical protein [Pirellulales bacterium]
MDPIRYFDINSRVQPVVAQAVADGGQQKTLHWFPQWITLVAGIVIQPFFANYRVNGVWAFEGFSGWTLFAVIAGVIIFPSVYRQSFDDKPLIVSLGPIFTAGLGWEALLGTAIKAVEQLT